MYHLFDPTKTRLAKWPSITCIKGDSFERLPKLLAAIPESARVVVIVDGPKGQLGLSLVNQALLHPKVALAAFHATAPVWNLELYKKMIANPEGLLMTSEGQYRRVFGSMDTKHGEAQVLAKENKLHGWKVSKIPRLLESGNGLWVVGKSRLLSSGSAHSLTRVCMLR